MMRNFILIAFLFYSCTPTSSSNQSKSDSTHTDSIAKSKPDSTTKKISDKPTKSDSAQIISPRDLPLFSTFPEIKKQGKTMRDFIPDGWKILDSLSADFNDDAQKDFAIILQHKDSVRMIDFTNDFVDTLVTQPRMVMVVLYDNLSSQYSLSERNNFFIPNHDRENMEDPFLSMKFQNGILQFDFQYFANVGSYEVSNISYKFRCQSGNFILIGGDYLDYMRNSGITDECSYDFITKKMKLTKGGSVFDETKKGNVEWDTFVLDKMKTLSTMEPPGTWEVKKGNYL